jgi:hypothetical protein
MLLNRIINLGIPETVDMPATSTKKASSELGLLLVLLVSLA